MGSHLIYTFADSVFLVVDIFYFLVNLVSWNHNFGLGRAQARVRGAKSGSVVYKTEASTSFLETASGRR